ncbi:MAG: hypothetical protein KQI78_25315 [Deltaproteobacteria bacterium]|nr:hypothetical protein [Deltaproteobacteria bacterium]
MKYGIIEGYRSLPKPRMKGQCPVCGNDVVSKCGNKTIWHWAHVAKKHCDSWWENETQWHRDWKDKYPTEWQEVVLFDEISGEKHIADIKTDSGLVIEFQNSPLTSEELKQREAFYKNIVWVINGDKFRNNFHILHGLPDPKSYLVEDIVFYPRKHHQQGELFYRKSENPGNPSMVEIHGIHEIQDEINKEYRGHHVYDWVRPRTVWYESSKKVYIDFGNEFLWNLQIYDDRGLPCVQAISKLRFLKESGSKIES